MTISYRPLWVMLAERDMRSVELQRATGLSNATMSKLRRNGEVNVSVLIRIAEVLQCGIGEIAELR